MIQFSLIILCLILGQLCSYYPKFSKDTAKSINAYLLYITVPAIIIIKIPELFRTVRLSLELLIPVSMPWLMFILSYALFYFLGRKFNWSREKTAALILTSGLANTSFVGFPLIEALRGADSIKYAVISDQLGTFLTFSTLGLFVANAFSKGRHSDTQQTNFLKQNLFNVIKFPPIITLILITLLCLFKIYPPNSVIEVLTPISKTLGPLAFFAVGFALKINTDIFKKYYKALALGITFKLILCPLIFTVLYRSLFHSHSEMTTVTILESAMASMITASIICNEFDLEADLANLMVGISIPLSLLTVPLLNSFL